MMSFKVLINVELLTMINIIVATGLLRVRNEDARPRGNIEKRFILTDNLSTEWVSWQQHIACLTTCLQGLEAQIVDCCTTGDNKLCFDLPWNFLNKSVGNCASFCDRRDDILCNQHHSKICGSDGRLYHNSCEWTKMRCVDKSLTQKDIKFCQNLRTLPPLEQNNTKVASMSSESLPSSSTKISALTHMASPAVITTSLPTTTIKTTAANTQELLSTKTTSNLQSQKTSPVMPTTLISTQVFSHSVVPTTLSSAVPSFAPTPPSYCQNKHSISCGFTFNIVCGSDGKLYANLCMLALGRCDNPSLTQKDRQYCSTS